MSTVFDVQSIVPHSAEVNKGISMALTEQSTGSSERSPGKRAGLDLQQILKAARSIHVSNLSMQTLADALKVDRKALNYHVNDRQTLLGMVAMDAFSSHFEASEVASASSWQDACRSYALHFIDGALALGDLAEHLWFGDVPATLFLKPTEGLFAQFNAAGFRDETAVRLTTMLVTICLGHVHDIIQAANLAERPRPRLLRTALDNVDIHNFENLARVSKLGVDTYNREQACFAIDVFLNGATTVLDLQGKV